MTAVPGLTPRLPVMVVAFVLVTVDPARIANPLADPSATADWQLHSDVAKLQTTSFANDVPAWLFAPVVIVAVNAVLAAKSDEGVNVAAFFTES